MHPVGNRRALPLPLPLVPLCCTRRQAGREAFLATAGPALSFLATGGENDLTRAVMVKLKYK
jgi:hypothetical protein